MQVSRPSSYYEVNATLVAVALRLACLFKYPQTGLLSQLPGQSFLNALML
jgi:hypothetical protein